MKNLIFTLLLLCSVSFSFAQVPNYVPTNGLVGWWPFNGNANDESGNGNNGTVNGATLTTDRTGTPNSSYSFNGSGAFINVPNSSSLQFNNQITISIWLNASILNSPANYLLSKGADGGTPYSWTLPAFPTGLMELNLWDNNNGNNTISTSTSINTNQWHHVVITYDGFTGKAYLDGLLNSSTSFSASIFSNIYDLKFGRRHTSGLPYFFNGKLDDIGIWNRALNAQEVSNLFTATNCANNLSISPTQNSVQRGNTATFTATTSDPNPTIIWQSDFGQGFQTLNNFGNYSGTNTATLNISNMQLNNHTQPVRAISTSGNCVDTSAVSVINVLDTCVTTVFDTVTTFISVTDTLIINSVISSVNPPNNVNTLLIYPNPANTHITIDNGNFATMTGYSVRINNALGQLVFNQNITQQQFFIDLSTWTGPGLYYVNILDPNGNPIEVKKIVLQ